MMKARQKSLVVVTVLGLFAGTLALMGCDSGSTDTTTEGSVRVLLTDAPFPFDLVAEANVTIDRVELVGEDGIIVLVDAPQPFNLLELQDGVTAELADLDVPAGTYSQVRLIVSEDASVVLTNDEIFDLKVPSGTQTGLKVLLPPFDIDEEADLVEVTVDFDVSDSFVVQGNPDTPAGIKGFLFKPVIKPLLLEINGEEIDLDEDPE